MSDNYTVDILVNDKPIRKFSHEGKLFVEARQGQTYTIRIKNNSCGRILAVSSVDGLDVLNGKKAKENSNGYVVNGYNSLTIDGFRVSDEKVAKFEFDLKGESYAATKGDNSEKNCGVIGVRLFAEKIKPEPIVIREDHHHHHYPKYPHNPWNDPWYPKYPPYNPPYTITCESTWGGDLKSSTTFSTSQTLSNSAINNASNTPIQCYNMSVTGNLSGKIQAQSFKKCVDESVLRSAKGIPRGFDMGTKFGEAKESKVIEVEFEKGILTFTQNIYYASRESLIEMGVPIGNEKQVSFPEPFEDTKYAKPPKGWKA